MEHEEAVRPCWMEIDLGALAHNTRTLRRQLGDDVKIIAALKADAYGHGIGPVAQRLEECGVHGVATGSLEDALDARRAGVELPILMFAGPLPGGMGRLLEHGLTPTVHDWTSARAVANAAKGPTPVYVKVDSGLGRLGIRVAEAFEFIEDVRRLDHLEVEGVYTHLPFHDHAERTWAQERLARFDALLERLEAAGIHVPVTQSLASSALMSGLTSRANAVCPGALLYGMTPVDEQLVVAGDYRPVVRAVKARLIHRGVTEQGVPVGVVPLGLVDGYARARGGARAQALWRGRRIPVRGVSLEYTVLDLSEAETAEVGDEIVLLGRSGDDEIALAELAAWQDDAVHIVLLRFDGRLRARYVDAD